MPSTQNETIISKSILTIWCTNGRSLPTGFNMLVDPTF